MVIVHIVDVLSICKPCRLTINYQNALGVEMTEKCFYDTGTRYEIIDEYHLSSFGKGNTLPIAIMRAFLTVMGEV
jgi:hypothetical protein